MTQYKKILFIICCCSFAYLPGYCRANQVSNTIEIPSSFNPVGSGARALGMGGAFISNADDATAASWNPAALIQLRKPEIAIVAAHFQRNKDNVFGTNPEASGQQQVSNSNLNYLSFSLPCGARTCGYNMIFSFNHQNLFNMDRKWSFPFNTNQANLTTQDQFDYQQKGDLYATDLAYAIQITPALSLGLTLNLWNDGLSDNSWTQTYTISRTGQLGSLALKGNDMFQDKFEFEGENMNLGAYWKIYQHGEQKVTLGFIYKTKFTADVKHTNSFNTSTVFPTEPDLNQPKIIS